MQVHVLNDQLCWASLQQYSRYRRSGQNVSPTYSCGGYSYPVLRILIMRLKMNLDVPLFSIQKYYNREKETGIH
jgi:hypothetical protein